jgi:probable DNA repair protein
LDFKSFLHWARHYRRALDDNDWIDAPLIAVELASGGQFRGAQKGPVIWADIAQPTPAQQALYRQLDHDGWQMAEWLPPIVQRRSCRVRLPDSSSELTAAAQWAGARLAHAPTERLALVIPELAARRNEVRRVLEDTLDPSGVLLGSATRPAYFNPHGEPGELQPPIGAAMTSLELLSSRGTFNTLSRWLRSPYIASEPGEACARSTLEMSLRVELSAQLNFVTAYKTGGLAERLREAVPGLATRLSHALQSLHAAPRYATPTRWARVWQQVLTLLGWPAGVHDPHTTVVPLWENALNKFSLLTPVVGSLSMTEALAELDLILAQPSPAGPIPLTGLSLLERLEDIGPGYDAVWVAGLTDAHWPRPAQANPLLPLRLQLDHGMPGASPQVALERCQLATRRLIDRTPELIFSWPSRVHEYPAEPSPLLASVAEVEPATLILQAAPRLAERMAGTRKRECREDPGPSFEAKEIHGGAGTLSVQARCPLRAFIESRLGARPLEPSSRGLNARQRGIITHRALELFLRRLPERTELAAWEPAARDAWTASCVEQALHETFGPAQSLLRVLYDLERDRLLLLVASLVASDLKRADFKVDTVEERQVVELKDFRLSCRLDRIDTLAAGGVAIIDYKTGRNTSPADWFKARLRDTQLPLYAQIPGEQVTATVIAAVRVDGIQFKGVWAHQEDFPGQAAKLPDERTWSKQLEVWREQLEVLVAEYAAGDTRILLADLDEAKGSFAPLTRVYEQLALSHGWIDTWTAP